MLYTEVNIMLYVNYILLFFNYEEARKGRSARMVT